MRAEGQRAVGIWAGLGVGLARAAVVLIAACAPIPAPIKDIDWKAYNGFEYRYSAFLRPVACEGPMVGDCTEYSARVQCLAAQRGLQSRLVLSADHVHTEVLHDGTWWEIDLDGVSASEN